ncbi:MAG: thiamine-phosphate kinase [Gammaproteobacteria bacterium]|nr:thiamine-phosphate kinase [Gammaproteobacteria bacterium]NND39563.1 thiamine-phosphate kinase [Pseudomonadales bacterium]NNM10805.1 thiamine-phosphate kinase [Pseudomonadales bacterium]
MSSEFDIISQYFTFSTVGENGLGVGDDAAIFEAIPGTSNEQAPALHAPRIVAACDTLLSGVHFPADASGGDVAHRSLAVNLSDFAAMGAQPQWLLLSLCLPDNNQQWLQQFSACLSALCADFDLRLIGGDTTRGPLAVTFTVLGALPAFAGVTGYLARSGASAGEDLWLSGSLGAAAAWLALHSGQLPAGTNLSIDSAALSELRQHFYSPTPRLALGQGLLGTASSAIDISDGLLADASHLAKSSCVSLQINGDSLPCHAVLTEYASSNAVRAWMLAGGDDYELLFTAPAEARERVQQVAHQAQVPVSRIGCVVADSSANRVELRGDGWHWPERTGYRHF